MRYMSEPGGARLKARDILGDFGWFPEDYAPGTKSISFVRTDAATLAQQTFLDQRWNRTGRARTTLTLDAIASEIPEEAPLPEMNFIWHTSFCCSTLIAAALQVANRNLSLKEPIVLATAANMKRAAAFDGAQVHPRLFEIVFRLLARRPESDAAITVKPSNFANILVRDAARLTSGKSLFLYSDLPSFLISVAKSGLQLSKYARRLFFGILRDEGKPMRWSAAELFQMSDLEVAAIAWHMQIAEFRRSWDEMGEGRVASLNCDAFLARPQHALERLDTFFGYGLGSEAIQSIVNGPVFSHHAKLPQAPFGSEQRRVEQDRARKLLGADLDRVIAWSHSAFPEAAGGTPLPGALLS
jgi:hypothetical protein